MAKAKLADLTKVKSIVTTTPKSILRKFGAAQKSAKMPTAGKKK